MRLEQSASEVAVTYVDAQGRQNQVRAGEHTSKLLLAWMNGAIESGERAADEVIAAGC